MTIMEQESRQAPGIVAEQIRKNHDILTEVSKRLKKNPPPFAVTIARGSSDHAATFAKYLIETKLGLATSSAAPSVLTLYKSKLDFKGSLAVGISQSGESPDICEVMKQARKGGAITVSFVNHQESHMAKESEYVVPLYAKEERAVAATKSYIATLSALLHMVSLCSDDSGLLKGLKGLPGSLENALSMDWSCAIDILKDIKDTLVIARGYCYPIAQEAALKFKETCSIHAEAFSGAEVLHGPFALIKKDYPVLMFTEDDNSLAGIIGLAKKIKALGAKTLLACPKGEISTSVLKDISSVILPLPESAHRLCDPLVIIQAFYPMIAYLSVKRGFNPDSPDNLKKITETL